jgi:hypothetical protein
LLFAGGQIVPFTPPVSEILAGGFVQDLSRVLAPAPHVAEHCDLLERNLNFY